MKHSPLLAALILSLGIHGLLLTFPDDAGNSRPAPAASTEIGLVYIAAPVTPLPKPAPAAPVAPETPVPARAKARTPPKKIAFKAIAKVQPRRIAVEPPRTKEPAPEIPSPAEGPAAPPPFPLPAPATETTPPAGTERGRASTTAPAITTPPSPSLATLPGQEAGAATSAAAVEPTPQPPRYRYNPRPEYPVPAMRRRWQGEVLLRVRVDVWGEVSDVRLEASSGYDILDQAALKAVHRWKFHPAHDGERNIPQEVCLPIRFELSNH